jgi:hypothetical protein
VVMAALVPQENKDISSQKILFGFINFVVGVTKHFTIRYDI